jgi:RNA polymerase sigma-70 factor (ECF subfamily)
VRILGRQRGATPSAAESLEELRLIEALRAGDEDAFMRLVDMYGPSLLKIALMYVSSRAVAEEVVQETWLGVLNGIDRFEGRSSFKTWLFRILTNIAKTRGVRESRSIPFSSHFDAGSAPGEPAVDPERFLGPDQPGAGAWSLAPTSWETPEESLASGETRDVILTAIDALPGAQREVVTMRDLLGFGSEEVCNALDLTDTNQRVLLHRGRSKVRAALEQYLGATEKTTS